MHYFSLCAYHLLYFIATGASTFLSKYYGDIGMTVSQIGLLTSVPTLVALAVQPSIGSLSDRVRFKRQLLGVLLVTSAAICFLAGRLRTLALLLPVVCLYRAVGNSLHPLGTDISLEYTEASGKPYGPVRLLGTVGYQLGALLVGWLLSDSLNGLYPMLGTATLAAALTVFIMPDVKGHQHARKKVPMLHLLQDSHLRWLYIMLFVSAITTQFHIAFLARHLGDLGLSNGEISAVTVLSVMIELPFLWFGDRIARRTSVWNFLMIGFLTTGLRWIGLSCFTTLPGIVAAQVPGVTVLACFEFIPSIWLIRRVPKEQSGAAQSLHNMVIFGAGSIVGGMLGGLIAEQIGIRAMYAVNGVLILEAAAFFWPVTRRMIREEAG